MKPRPYLAAIRIVASTDERAYRQAWALLFEGERQRANRNDGADNRQIPDQQAEDDAGGSVHPGLNRAAN